MIQFKDINDLIFYLNPDDISSIASQIIHESKKVINTVITMKTGDKYTISGSPEQNYNLIFDNNSEIPREWLDILRVKSEKEIKNISDEKWKCIPLEYEVSEEFIEKFQDKINWGNVSYYQQLSEGFIEKFQDKVAWYYISANQKLSEEFIDKFQDKVDWDYISICQKLSEEFIEKFQDKIAWNLVSQYQKLSESFIDKFQDRVDWHYISIYQKLSEEFIKKFQGKLNLYYISKYQKLSQAFIKKYNIKISENNWLYVSEYQKMKAIKECGKYEIDGDYIIAYKSTKIHGISTYNSQYVYEVGKTYESNCNCNINEKYSFGLSAWTKEDALNYCPNGGLYKVKIHIDDIGALVKNSNEIRCFKLEVIEEVG